MLIKCLMDRLGSSLEKLTGAHFYMGTNQGKPTVPQLNMTVQAVINLFCFRDFSNVALITYYIL